MGSNKTIGLFGLDFTSTNLGCGALAYSFLTILTQRVLTENNYRILIFSVVSDKVIENIPDGITYENVKYSPRSISSNMYLAKRIKECDVIFDFTGGDSFSDIYGLKRFLAVSLTKIMAIKLHKKLILGPQTYGPTNSWISKIIFKYIAKMAYKVYSRDNESTVFTERITGVCPQTYIDVAFALPYEKNEIAHMHNKTKVGINVSGLLWNGGYTEDNQFGLTVDYRKYIEELIGRLTNDDSVEVHLIPHVLSGNYDSLDNDVKAVDYIKLKYDKCIKSPLFKNPMEAKRYISSMDVFTGARMHSTIAAISSGVVVVPFSYSRKFEGLYKTLDYEYCIGGCSMSTDEAVETTLDYIHKYKSFEEKIATSRIIADDRINRFVDELIETMKSV